MKLTRLLTFSTGMAVGYVAGSAAGRTRYIQIKNGASKVAAELGLDAVSNRLGEDTHDLINAAGDGSQGSSADWRQA